MVFKLSGILAMGVAAALAQAASTAVAAPQALALLERDDSVPLVCADGICRAEFTSYCLQQARPLPDRGTIYTVAGGDVMLVLHGADGTLSRLAATPHVKIRTARAGHTAVTIEIAAATLARLGAQRAAIAIGPRVTLAPLPVAGDPDPMREAERLAAAGPLREAGARIIDRRSDVIVAARGLNRLVNALPGAVMRGSGARKRLWQHAMAAGLARAPAAEQHHAAREYATCWASRMVQVGGLSARECIARRHDRVMWGETMRYWVAVRSGS